MTVNKKLLLGLGGVAALAFPIVAITSCSSGNVSIPEVEVPNVLDPNASDYKEKVKKLISGDQNATNTTIVDYTKWNEYWNSEAISLLDSTERTEYDALVDSLDGKFDLNALNLETEKTYKIFWATETPGSSGSSSTYSITTINNNNYGYSFPGTSYEIFDKIQKIMIDSLNKENKNLIVEANPMTQSISIFFNDDEYGKVLLRYFSFDELLAQNKTNFDFVENKTWKTQPAQGSVEHKKMLVEENEKINSYINKELYMKIQAQLKWDDIKLVKLGLIPQFNGSTIVKFASNNSVLELSAQPNETTGIIEIDLQSIVDLNKYYDLTLSGNDALFQKYILLADGTSEDSPEIIDLNKKIENIRDELKKLSKEEKKNIDLNNLLN